MTFQERLEQKIKAMSVSVSMPPEVLARLNLDDLPEEVLDSLADTLFVQIALNSLQSEPDPDHVDQITKYLEENPSQSSIDFGDSLELLEKLGFEAEMFERVAPNFSNYIRSIILRLDNPRQTLTWKPVSETEDHLSSEVDTDMVRTQDRISRSLYGEVEPQEYIAFCEQVASFLNQTKGQHDPSELGGIFIGLEASYQDSTVFLQIDWTP